MNFGDMMSSMNEELEKNPDIVGGGEKKQFEKDERFYKISKDKDGSGSVVIRFLPTFNKDKTALMPIVKMQMHNPEVFNPSNPKEKRFISEPCPKTIDKDADCPICDYCWDNFNEGRDAGLANDDPQQKKFLKFATKDRYYSNIMVIKDDINPENNGKIFILDYGPAVAKLIKRDSNPTDKEVEFKGKTKFNPWDVFNGKDFVLTLTSGKFTDNGFPSWNDSFFATNTSAAAGVTDEKSAMELIGKTHDLNEFHNPEKFLNGASLEKRLEYVLFKNAKAQKKRPAAEDSGGEDNTPQTGSVEDMYKTKPTSTPEPEKAAPSQADVPWEEPAKKEEAPKEKAESGPVSTDDFFKQFEV